MLAFNQTALKALSTKFFCQHCLSGLTRTDCGHNNVRLSVFQGIIFPFCFSSLIIKVLCYFLFYLDGLRVSFTYTILHQYFLFWYKKEKTLPKIGEPYLNCHLVELQPCEWTVTFGNTRCKLPINWYIIFYYSLKTSWKSFNKFLCKTCLWTRKWVYWILYDDRYISNENVILNVTWLLVSESTQLSISRGSVLYQVRFMPVLVLLSPTVGKFSPLLTWIFRDYFGVNETFVRLGLGLDD